MFTLGKWDLKPDINKLISGGEIVSNERNNYNVKCILTQLRNPIIDSKLLKEFLISKLTYYYSDLNSSKTSEFLVSYHYGNSNSVYISSYKEDIGLSEIEFFDDGKIRFDYDSKVGFLMENFMMVFLYLKKKFIM